MRLTTHRSFRLLHPLDFEWLILIFFLAPAAAGAGPPFNFEFRDGTAVLPVAGFVPDVPLALSPKRHFLAVPEQSRDGLTARITVIRLDDQSGRPLDVNCVYELPGFREGYGPRFIAENDEGATLYVPYGSKGGGGAGVLFLTVDAAGFRTRDREVTLGDLDFRPRVRGIPANSNGLFCVENRDHTARGLVLVDGGSAGRNGGVTLVSSDERISGDLNITAPWLPPLAPGVEPVLIGGLTGVLVYPTEGPDGADVLFVSAFTDPVRYHRESLKARNPDSRPPLRFTGFPGNVPFPVFYGQQGIWVVVPVTGPGDQSDVLLVGGDGVLEWSLSKDAERRRLAIPAFQDDVRLEILQNELFVPIESPVADLWSVDMNTGTIIARARDNNRDMPPWRFATAGATYRLLTPVQLSDGHSGLLLFNPDLNLDATLVDSTVLGFRKWVPPIAGYIPVISSDSTRTDLLYFTGPHLSGASSLRSLNPDLVLSDYQRGVDPLILDGGGYLFLPEESPTTGEARLRVFEAPGIRPQLAIATPGGRGGRGTLAFLDAHDQTLTWQVSDVWGLVPGVGMFSAPLDNSDN